MQRLIQIEAGYRGRRVLKNIFLKNRGYNVLDIIPYFYFKGEKSAKIRHDYWRTVSERFKEVYSVQIGVGAEKIIYYSPVIFYRKISWACPAV